jgi:hypothetical protein
MDPASGPATPAEARVRLEGAFVRFDQECRRRDGSGQHVVSTGFGTVSIDEMTKCYGVDMRRSPVVAWDRV